MKEHIQASWPGIVFWRPNDVELIVRTDEKGGGGFLLTQEFLPLAPTTTRNKIEQTDKEPRGSRYELGSLKELEQLGLLWLIH